MTPEARQPLDRPTVGIVFVCLGVMCITANDAIVKQLSATYPLHQAIFMRSAIGLVFSLTMVQFEGGFRALRAPFPGLHAIRCFFMVVANMAFFLALSTTPLADATAVFFVAPLFITVFSALFLGEKVGIRRLSAVLLGFIGVLIMLEPGSAMFSDSDGGFRWSLLLPVVAALAYACMQVFTRRLAGTAPASVLAAYVQITFVVIGIVLFLVAGDGRFAEGLESKSLIFLLRAWVWPTPEDWERFLLLGVISAAMSYCMAQAYRSAAAATIAPFEYLALPMAIFWGWYIFGDLPTTTVVLGAALIASSGVYVYWREQRLARRAAVRPTSRPTTRGG